MARRKDNSRRSDITTLKEGFSDLLSKYHLESKFDEQQLIHSWAQVMGKPIADRTDNLFIKDKKLFVKLTSAPLRQELTLSKSKILELFHKEFGHNIVDDIVFL